MTNDDLIKSIRGVVKEEIDSAFVPIKADIQGIKGVLDEHTEKLDGLTDQLVDVSEDVAEIKEVLKLHDVRISKIEDHLDLPTPLK